MTERQMRLGTGKIKYSLGAYNKIKGDMQKVRLTEGCPHNCPFCYEPQEFKIFEMPEIERNKVIFSDMNILAKKEAVDIIQKLGETKVNGKPVYYEFECGVDYRFLTQKISDMLYKYRFGNFNYKNGRWKRNIKIAWDWEYKAQFRRIYDAVNMLMKSGYKSTQISVFMVCNWKIPMAECLSKLQALSAWRILVNDCWYDNQKRGSVVPIHWTREEIDLFEKLVRKHNHLVSYDGYDPEIKKR